MAKKNEEVPEKFMVHDTGEYGYCGNPEWHEFTMAEIVDHYSADRIPHLRVHRIGERVVMNVSIDVSEYVPPAPPKAKKAKKKVAQKSKKK